MAFRLFSFCFALLLSSVVFAADFRFYKGTGNQADRIGIQGEINPGDYERFQKFLIQPDNIWAFANYVILSSPGGSVTEALKFANLFENASAKVMVVDQCYSSCFIMYAGSVDRTLVGVGALGVHRISLREEETNFKKAKSLISPQATTVRAYLSYLGVPSIVLDKMNETPASGLYKMDHYTLKEQNLLALSGYQPIFLDIAEKACGNNPDPYPEEYIVDRPRSSPQVMQAIGAWVKCVQKVRLSNFKTFMIGEYRLLLAGKPSILFPPNSLAEVDQNIFH